MGSKVSTDKHEKNENDGINQNINKVHAEIKNTIQVKNDTVIILLIVIIIIAVLAIIWYLNSMQRKSLRKKYSAPRPAIL